MFDSSGDSSNCKSLLLSCCAVIGPLGCTATLLSCCSSLGRLPEHAGVLSQIQLSVLERAGPESRGGVAISGLSSVSQVPMLLL